MRLTLEQALAQAPDSSSAAAGQKLSSPDHWQELGQNESAIWGLCRGSSLYRVRIDRSNLGTSCSCPSRKFPCKHAMGLLILAATSPESIPEDEPSDWVADWIEKRQTRQQKAAESAPAPVRRGDEKSRQKRIDQRDSRVRDGIQRLNLWMADLVRNGLAGLETRPRTFWEDQARRLVDAQAPGLASRVQSMADLIHSGPNWPAKLLDELGRTRLLTEAYSRLSALPEPLQEDIRQLVGWTVNSAELEQTGEVVEDDWVVIGQWEEDGDRLRTQRNWLTGLNSRRSALILQFAPGTRPFAETLLVGSALKARLRFYPGSCPLRARLEDRLGPPQAFLGRLPGSASVSDFLDAASTVLSKQPLLGRMSAVILDVSLSVQEADWHIVDSNSNSLPLAGRDYWKLLAITGGNQFDLCAEWNGTSLRPLGLVHQGTLRAINHTPTGLVTPLEK